MDPIHGVMSFNAEVDPIRHFDFQLTIQRRHLRLPDGCLAEYREQEVDVTKSVTWKIKSTRLVAGCKISSGRVSMTTAKKFCKNNHLNFFTEVGLVNLLGTFWQPMFKDKILLPVATRKGDRLLLVEPDAAKARSLLSYYEKESAPNRLPWLLVE